MKVKREKFRKSITAWICVLVMIAGCFSGFGSVFTESKAADTTDTGYTELTFSDFGQEDRVVTAGSSSYANITSWDNVAINGTIALPATGGSYISFGGNAADKGVQIKFGGDDKIHMGVVYTTQGWVSEGLQRADLGYADTESLAGKEIPIRLTFEPVGDNYLVTLEGIGVNGQKDTATMTIPKDAVPVYRMDFVIGGPGKEVSIYSESIKTSKDTYNSEELIQVKAVSRSGDWVGIFEESATAYTKETAKAWYSVADYNGTAYDMPAQAAGNYKVCLMMNESTALLSKKITVEQYVEKTYTELTFSDFGQEDRTVTAASQSFANITSWDNVAINGTIALPATGGSYISFGGNAVDKGVQIKFGGDDKIHMGVVYTTQGWVSEGLQRADLGYADTESLAGKEIPIRLTFEPVGDNYLITLEGIGVNGQKDTATMTIPKDAVPVYRMDIVIGTGNISIYSEGIKTDRDVYSSEWEIIQTTAVGRSADWVGVFEEDEFVYTKENAKVWYNIADYNGKVYNMPAQEAGTYKVALIMNESTKLYSKTITVVQNEYTELTFSDFGLDDQTVQSATATGSVSLSSWDKVAISGIIKLPATGGSYIRFGGNAVDKGVEIKYGGAEKIHMGVVGNPEVASEGLQRADLGYEDTDTVANKEIPIQLTFYDQADGTYLVTLTGTGVNGKRDVATMTIQSAVLSDYDMLIYSSATDKTVSIYSTKKNVSANDVSYNIEEEPYLLTGNYIVTKNGESVEVDEEEPILSQTGDYEVTTEWNGITSSRTVSLYILGDVNLSCSTKTESDSVITLTEDDVNALKSILAGTTEPTTAQKKAADLTNDGAVNNTDLKLLQDIVAGKQTRENLIDKYYPAAVRYEYLEDGDGKAVMPIVGWEGVLLSDSSHYEGLKEAGINMILSNTGDYQDANIKVDTVLELAQKQGIGYLVKDNRIQGVSYDSTNTSLVSGVNPADVKTMAQKMGAYSYFDSYLGNYVMDEPTLVRADGMYITPKDEADKRNFAHYKTITEQFNSYANTSGYINIPAAVWCAGTDVESGYNGNANGFHLTSESIEWYKKVVGDITGDGDAKVLSFDRYVRGQMETPDECPRYFLNLDIIRTQAKNSNIPFWSYVPVGRWTEGNTTISRQNNAEEMFWATNTSLAFGAKGIQYFTTTEPQLYSDDVHEMGIYSSEGNKNATWYNAVDRMNTLIEAVDDVLMKSENKGIIATGGNALNNAANITYTADGRTALTMGTAAVSDYIKDNTPDYSAIKSDDGVSRVKEITTTNATAGALAGVFNYQGKVALYVVNNDTANAQDITVTFTDASNYRVIGFNSDNTIDEVTALGSSCTRNVKAGEAFLIVIDEEALETTTQYFDDITAYREKDNYTAPELDGYVFAGWYKSEEAATKEYTYDTTTSVTASDEEKIGALKEYKELTFYNFSQKDREVTSGSQGTTTEITTWDNVVVSGTMTLPATGGSYISFGGNAVDKGVQIKYGGEDKIHMGVVYTTHTDWVSAGLQRADLGYADTDTLAGKAIPIRLTFEPIGDNYLVTLEGTGVNGQKDTATMTIPKDAIPVYRMDLIISSAEKSITISSAVPTRVQPAYAKFVDESILSVKAQITPDTTDTSAKTNMRLVTTVDSLIYQNVGFKICTDKVPNGIEKDITNVYRKIVAASGGIKFPYAPSVFDSHSQFFGTVTVENLAVAGNTDKELRITPYWKTLDGTKVYGVERTLTLADGIAAIAAVQ